jgi:type II secretion system protein G
LGKTNSSNLRLEFHVKNKNFSSLNSQISNPRGFTLIELITVIGVLGVLSAIILAVVNPLEQFNKSQDSKRKQDLAQVQRALEVYYNDFHRYPPVYQGSNINEISTDGTSNTAIAWGHSWSPYMDVLPIDPKAAKNYAYWSDSTGQSYAIYASLDRGSHDPQACNNGNACQSTIGTGIGGTDITCGTNVPCNYGVTSPNISP